MEVFSAVVAGAIAFGRIGTDDAFHPFDKSRKSAMGIIRAWLLIACALITASVPAYGESSIESRSIAFAKGASSAKVEGSIKGDQIVDYKLRARSGQTMSVTLKSSNLSNYFNVLPPGSTDVAIFVGSSGGDEWTGSLPTDGVYTVRVYLMRNAARRNESARYNLTVGITGAASAALGTAPASDAKVAGTPYHATGQVPCSMGDSPRGSAQCEFGVIRGRAGNAQLHVTPPGGLERVLTFQGDKVSSDAASKVKASKSDDTWWIEVNDYEHYQIPEAVIFGD